MGYRSTIHIKVEKLDEDKLLEILKEHDLDRSFDKLYDIEDQYVRYIGYDLKWYNGYKDVEAVNSFINEETENARGLIAVGEDSQTIHYGETSELEMYEITTVEW